MGATRLGARETKPLGNGRDLALPAARARGQGELRGFRPPTRDARGSEAASQLPWEGCPYPSRALVAGSQAGGNRTWCLRLLAAPLRRAPFRPPPGASRQLGAGPAARGDAAGRSAWVRACPGGAGPRLRAKGPGGGCAMSCS